MKQDDLKTSLQQFEEIWAKVDKTRSTSKTVTVSKQGLMNLLMDHAKMWDELEEWDWDKIGKHFPR